ncbi:MAG: hypothetical protein IPN76_09285 [Saprospiraceae bacterium]|nr:hypothetical protein [Saprospiraceae bacterium]
MENESFINELNSIEAEILRIGGVPDGIVNLDEYLKADIKIMWILKEANSQGNNEWSMRGALNDGYLINENGIRGGWGRTFNPIIYTTVGILSNKNWGEINWVSDEPELIEILKKIAFVNVKKVPGNSVCDNEQMKSFYQQNKSILVRQIKLAEPDVIICGNTFWLIQNELKIKDFTPVKNFSKEFPINFFYSTKRMVIDAYHPNNRSVSQEDYCDSIIEAVIEWNKNFRVG